MSRRIDAYLFGQILMKKFSKKLSFRKNTLPEDFTASNTGQT